MCEPTPSTSSTPCIDNDGDGYGEGCAAGPDYDDQNGDLAVLVSVAENADGDALSVMRLSCVSPFGDLTPTELPVLVDCDDRDGTRTLGCSCTDTRRNGVDFELCSERHAQQAWAAHCGLGKILAVMPGSGAQDELEAV